MLKVWGRATWTGGEVGPREPGWPWGGGCSYAPPAALGPPAGLVGKRPVSRADFSPVLGSRPFSSPSGLSSVPSWRRG